MHGGHQNQSREALGPEKDKGADDSLRNRTGGKGRNQDVCAYNEARQAQNRLEEDD